MIAKARIPHVSSRCAQRQMSVSRLVPLAASTLAFPRVALRSTRGNSGVRRFGAHDVGRLVRSADHIASRLLRARDSRFCAPKGRTAQLPRVQRSGTRGRRAAHDGGSRVDAGVSTGCASLHLRHLRGAALRNASVGAAFRECGGDAIAQGRGYLRVESRAEGPVCASEARCSSPSRSAHFTSYASHHARQLRGAALRNANVGAAFRECGGDAIAQGRDYLRVESRGT